MNVKVRYWARRPFGYGGKELDRGQVVELLNAPNDEKLVRLGYFQKLAKTDEVYVCAVCGAEFIGVGERSAHGDKRHSNRIRTPMEEEAMFEREERMLQEIAPLHIGQSR